MYIDGGCSAASSAGGNLRRRLNTDYTITESSGTPSGGTDGGINWLLNPLANFGMIIIKFCTL